MHSYKFLTDVFRGRLKDVVDGDTIDVFLDVAFHAVRVERLRLLDIDTSELKAKDPKVRARAQKAKDYVLRTLSAVSEESTWPLRVTTQKSDAFGRYLAVVYYMDPLTKVEVCLNTALLEQCLADKPKLKYQRKKKT